MLEENLQLGDTGNQVRILQEKLKILGFYHAIITGNFGRATEVGVRAFQNYFQLEETGIVDSEMWKMLFELTEVTYSLFSNYPTLSLGANNAYVRELKRKLKVLLYYTGTVNTTFDLETETAVKRLQFHNDLTTTGIVTPQTWNLIDILYGTVNECVKGNVEEESLTYTVVKGDTLFSIAQRYNTSVDDIKRLNQLTSNTLTIGQVLKIPTNATLNEITYTVVRGDTLFSIAQRYNTSVDAIKRLNQLTSNTLTIGQVIKIPTNATQNVITYTVVRGDTLFSIAQKYNTSVDEIKRLNQLTSNTLSIGQVLKIGV